MPRDTSFRKRLGDAVEVAVVLLLGFSLFIYSSTYKALNPEVSTQQTYDSVDFYFIVFFEVVVLGILALYLRARQWQLRDFHLDFRIHFVGLALLLAFVRQVLGYWAAFIMGGHSPSPDISFESHWSGVLLIILVNSVYEEVLLIGYFFKRFEPVSPVWIVLGTTLLRASFHTYQGWGNVLSVLFMGLLFGFFYTKYQKLWPLILAHAFSNTFAFLNEHYKWLP